MPTFLSEIPENFGLTDVWPVQLGASLPVAVSGRRALFEELIWDADTGFTDPWKGGSSLTGNPTDGFVMLLARRAFGAAALPLFAYGAVDFGGGGSEWTRLLSVKSFGAAGNGTTDDTAAIKNAMSALQPGGRLFFPAGEYKITDTLEFKGGAHANVTVYGENAGSVFFAGSTLVWAGGLDPTKPMIRSAAPSGLSFQNLRFRTSGTGGPYAYIAHGPNAALGLSTSVTGLKLIDISFEPVDANQNKYNVTIGEEGAVAGNLENSIFQRCSFKNAQHSLVYIGSGQPFNTLFDSCGFGSESSAAKSRAISVSVPSCTVKFRDCDFQNLETVAATVQMPGLSWDGGSVEHCKRFLSADNNDNDNLLLISIKNMRHSSDTITTDSLGPDVISGSNGDYFRISGAETLSMDEVSFSVGRLDPSAWQLYVGGGCRINARGCVFPKPAPFYRGPFISLLQSSNLSECVYLDPALTPQLRPMPRTWGTESPVGSFVIDGGSGVTVVGGVTFTRTPAQVVVSGLPTEPGVDFQVFLTVQSTTGTPAAGSTNPRVSSKSTVFGIGGTSFTCAVDAPPGPGNTVTVAYLLVR